MLPREISKQVYCSWFIVHTLYIPGSFYSLVGSILYTSQQIHEESNEDEDIRLTLPAGSIRVANATAQCWRYPPSSGACNYWRGFLFFVSSDDLDGNRREGVAMNETNEPHTCTKGLLEEDG
jgi:hypothetical protein